MCIRDRPIGRADVQRHRRADQSRGDYVGFQPPACGQDLAFRRRGGGGGRLTMAVPSYHVVRIAALPEEADVLQGRLYDIGCLGLEEIEGADAVILKTYFDAYAPLPHFLNDLKKRIGDIDVVDATTIGLTDASFRPAAFEPFSL